MIKTNKNKKYLTAWDIIPVLDDCIGHVSVTYNNSYYDNNDGKRVEMGCYLFHDLLNGKHELIQDNERLEKIYNVLKGAYPKAVIKPVKIAPQYAPELIKRHIAVSIGRG